MDKPKTNKKEFGSDNASAIIDAIWEVKKSIEKSNTKLIGISEGLYRLKRSLEANNVVLRDLTTVLRRLKPKSSEEVIKEINELKAEGII